ncbi:MAG: YicC family protein [Eubacterium sp.]|nr:YicC family protein [Eubacterium sp.]MDD7209564.1 YicC family protein [Lachnospiraceae bacterium]MDY5498448.1 YicC/YloC family endoribonuclease [Anaerobutyricum sp.]
MIKSMTGFGRGEKVSQDCKVTVEIKAVNHRYCDINMKLPRKLNYLETDVRNYLKKSIGRGKVDVFISYEDLTAGDVNVRLNEELGREYYQAIMKLGETLHINGEVTALQVARFSDVLTLEDLPVNQEYIRQQIMETLEAALEHFSQSREREGENLKEDILRKLDGMKKNVEFIEKRYPELILEYRRKLEDKVKELLGDTGIDESRIASEVVIYADKICVDEETVRLNSHIENMKEELLKGGAVGRKLDFIAQEMNREANTILSKANDMEVSNRAIDLKTEIEKIREQVQNIE